MNSKKHQYTAEELEILDYIEIQKPESVADIEAEKARYLKIFKEYVSSF